MVTRLAAAAVVLVPLLAGAIDPAALPPEQQENYEAFRVRCSKCHALEKPMNVHLTPDGWRRYVGKMKRRPGSGISDQSAEKIVAFLIHKDAPAQEPDGGQQ